MGGGVGVVLGGGGGWIQKIRERVHVVRVVSLHLGRLGQERSCAVGVVGGGGSSGRVQMRSSQLGRIAAGAVVAAAGVVVAIVVVVVVVAGRGIRACGRWVCLLLGQMAQEGVIQLGELLRIYCLVVLARNILLHVAEILRH